jgi:hypothetical protein
MFKTKFFEKNNKKFNKTILSHNHLRIFLWHTLEINSKCEISLRIYLSF